MNYHVKNFGGRKLKDFQDAIDKGGKFVKFQYCFSIIVFTFRQDSEVYYVHPENRQIPRIVWYSLISSIFGWWGIPWGPLWTAKALYNNFNGGLDVSGYVLEQATNNDFRSQYFIT